MPTAIAKAHPLPPGVVTVRSRPSLVDVASAGAG